MIPNDIPHGKQEWYINVGGIWQDVSLTATPRDYIAGIRVTPDIHAGTAHIEVDVVWREAQTTEAGSDTLSMRLAVFDGESRVEQTLQLTSTDRTGTATLKVDKPHLWSPDDPHLYTVEATLGVGESGREDSLSSRFGFREITTRDGQLFLNGEPLFLRCALDQDIYPDSIYTVPSEEFLRDEFRKAQELGLNSLRVHIKPPDPLYLNLADEMGLLIWAEIPSWRTFYVKRHALQRAARPGR